MGLAGNGGSGGARTRPKPLRKSSRKACKYWSKKVSRLHGIHGCLSQATEGLRTNFVRICQEKRELEDLRDETQKGSSQLFGSANGFPGEDAWVLDVEREPSALFRLGFWLPDFERGATMNLVLRCELDSHPPASIRRQKAAKLLQRQFVIIDLDHRLPFFVIVDQASEDPASGRPLMGSGSVLNLGGAQRRFHRDMLLLRRELRLRPE